MKEPESISSVIVTYRREQVLVDTIRYLLRQAADCPQFHEMIIVDQTEQHELEVEQQLQQWADGNKIRWIKLDRPNLVQAMNTGLMTAHSDLVLFTDDDVVPRTNLYRAHYAAHQSHPDAWAVVGQVLQPGEEPENLEYSPKGGHLKRFLDFPFRSTQGCNVENLMAGNLSVKVVNAVDIGSFDENFPPPVAARFESEFAKRIIKNGGKIWFEPLASLDHLAAPTGGVRSRGSHLASMSPVHGVGDYYFAMRTGKGIERIWYIAKKPFREISTKFHLRRPWWIPVKLIGEIRAFLWACRLLTRSRIK